MAIIKKPITKILEATTAALIGILIYILLTEDKSKQFHPTTGLEIDKENALLQTLLENSALISSFNLAVSVVAIIFAYVIYSRWSKDESIKLLMSDIQALKREAYTLSAIEIQMTNRSFKFFQDENAKNTSLLTPLDEAKALTEYLNSFFERALEYQGKKVAIRDEIIERGRHKIELRKPEDMFHDKLIEGISQLMEIEKDKSKLNYAKEIKDEITKEAILRRQRELQELINLTEEVKRII